MFDDMNRLKALTFTGLLVLLLSVTFVTGTSVRLLNLLEMVQLADRVFWGKCLSVEEKSGCTSSARMGHLGFQAKRQWEPMLIGLV